MTAPVLAVEGIRRRFGALEAVHAVSFEVRAGVEAGLTTPAAPRPRATTRAVDPRLPGVTVFAPCGPTR